VHVTANVNPKTKPLVAIDNEKVYVTILKPLGEGKETLVRLRSLSDKPENVKLTFPAGAPESIRYCTFYEEPGEPVTGAFTMIPYGLATFRLQFY
jgi:hypothetical protein